VEALPLQNLTLTAGLLCMHKYEITAGQSEGLDWRNNNWDLSVWGKNLTDDEYAKLTTAPQNFSGQRSYFLAEPRTYGATVRYDF
jgi:hypothetical protein